jgi:hypothetical protein
MLTSKMAKVACALAAFALISCCGCAPKEPARQPAAEVGGGTLPPEVSVRPERSGEWPVAGSSVLVLEKDGRLELRHAGGALLLAEVALELPAVAADGERIAYALRKTDGFGSAVAVAEFRDGVWHGPRTLVDTGTPDHVAISPDGTRVAYVAGADGIAALWLAAFDGGEPVQLTNKGLVKSKSGPPDGFVPLPHRSPPAFVGDRLEWESATGAHQVRLP